MKKLVVGDIHGCFQEFADLLDRAGLAESDEIIALGDLVDRGPDSVRVLDFFHTRPNARALQGNHERKHVLSFRGRTRPALSQIITREQIGDAAYPQVIEYFDGLPRFLDLPEAIVIHGMFEPGVPLDRQRETVIVGTLSGEGYLAEHDRGPWYDLYDGPKPIVFGHHDYLGNGTPLVREGRIYGIDTGCCHGNALTGLLLPEFRLISVASRRDYWSHAQQQYIHLRYSATADADLTWEAARGLLLAAERQADRSPAIRQRAAQLTSLCNEAEQQLRAILDCVIQENSRVLADLRATHAFDSLSPQKQGSLYAARIGRNPLSPLLHLARKGKMELSDLRTRFSRPAEVLEFACKVGAMSTDLEK